MDKYLMSSPTQLSQPYEMGNETTLMHLSTMDLYDTQFEIGEENESQTGTKTIRNSSDSQLELDDCFEELVPVSNNSKGLNISSNQMDSALTADIQKINLNNFNTISNKFQHSRNISLDDGFYNSQFVLNSKKYSQKISHQASLSTSSMISLNQDPPYAQIGHGKLHNSFSNTTIHSGESIPPLSSSVSNQSLSDSPSSFQQSHNLPQQYQQHQHQAIATPRKGGRNKSLSVSSMNNFTTPSRVGANANLSPVNLMSNKVGKTPYSKSKGHTRSRSRLSADFSNTHMLLNSVTKSGSLHNLAHNHLNPFYAPSTYLSPSLDRNSTEFDDIYTPLPTPHGRIRSSSNVQPLKTNLNGSWPHKTGGSNDSNRNDLLESIKIENQDNDAFKQLKKAKSYSNLNFTVPKSNGKLDKQMEHEQDEDYYVDTANLSLRFSSQIEPNNDTEMNIGSSNSTPEILCSPSNLTYNSNMGNMSYSVPSTVGASLSDLETSTHSSFSSDFISNEPCQSQGIDLLSPRLISSRLNSSSKNKNLLTTANFINSFTKSYPASTDLASIAVSPSNSNPSLPSPKLQKAKFQAMQANNLSGLLPPMATFSSINQAQSQNAFQQSVSQSQPLPADLKLPIKVSDKTDIIDPKKKHQCPLCHARFQRPEHVKRHMKSHSSEKPFECDEPNCGKRFNRKDNLKAHLKKIHGRKI